ncbi:hypothetical protein NECAME_04995 [Necator americanus]|uniref:Major facilitator superfamily (MFS) profile domain-containing protein n=1 Tax=Necator americanus TaxID=51031 RepID=W2SKH5_NECAM|nr:hypothetical protein NECAME_04995 [Necator americanus]ETN70174.1 hypothetical protein NECAME_04995 [Necator americanus]
MGTEDNESEDQQLAKDDVGNDSEHEQSKFLECEILEKEPEIPSWRYVIVVLATSVSAIGLSCSFAFNFACVCKVNGTLDTYEIYKEDPSASPVMYFSPTEMSMLYSAYPLGNFCMLLVMVLTGGFARMRRSIFCAVLISSLTTILVPPLYDWNIHTTVILKIIQGASVAPTVPLVGHVTAYWTPRAEIGVFVSLLTSYSQIGLFYLMATSGIACEYFGWRGIFYFNGFSSLVLAILWICLFRDHPSEMKRLKNEKKQSTKQVAPRRHEPVPYKAFFTSLPVWSCLIAAFGNFGGISPFMTFAPSILKKALNLTDIATSQYNTCSFILQLSLKLFSGEFIISFRIFSVHY